MKTTRRRCAEQSNSHSITPEIGFAAATFASLLAWSCLIATVPAYFVMPAVATTFLVFAAGFGFIAWRYRDGDPECVTYGDVAGALVLIGLFAAANIEPDHLVRIIATAPGAEE